MDRWASNGLASLQGAGSRACDSVIEHPRNYYGIHNFEWEALDIDDILEIDCFFLPQQPALKQ